MPVAGANKHCDACSSSRLGLNGVRVLCWTVLGWLLCRGVAPSLPVLLHTSTFVDAASLCSMAPTRAMALQSARGAKGVALHMSASSG